ncbi:MAG TPA: hypothetical protein PKY31_08310 [Spirochaetota bacterium]|nr:hypothetical protein [Spirochaetota bacterium]
MKKHHALKYLLLLPLICVVLLFACVEEDDDDEEKDCEPRPWDCHETNDYTVGTLSIRLTINAENPAPTINIYRGTVESGTLHKTITGYPSSEWSGTESLGDYSAKVDYTVGSVTVTAIDGDSISTYSEQYCEGPCYYLENASLDLTFDYDAFKEYLDGTDEECFIATAAFGSALAEEVVALRRFRDSVLRKSVPGRAFIGLYYRYSPPAARFIGRHETLRGAARAVLVPVAAAVSHPRIFLGGIAACAGCIILVIGLSQHRRRRA